MNTDDARRPTPLRAQRDARDGAHDGAHDGAPTGPPDADRPPSRTPWASVTACPNGPLLVRGDVEILGADGRPAPRRRATVALCRCGASGIKPYCDGSHKAIDFRTDDETTG